MSFVIRGGRAFCCVVALFLFTASNATAAAAAKPPATINVEAAVPIASGELTISALDGGCGDGNGCVWTQIDFDGSRNVFGPGDAGQSINLSSYDRSAKNRFNARFMAFYRGNGTFLSCINPGNNDRNLPLETDLLLIGGSGTHC